jgi:hypothetical protein
VTNDQLWGAVFLALGAFQAWSIYRSLESGKWAFWILGRVRIPDVDHRAHPIGFWAGVTWDVFAMIFGIFLGAYFLAPLVLRIFGK